MNRPMPFRASRPRGVANPLAMLLILATALPVVALEMDGHSYPDTVTVAGRTLHRIGAGKREATIFKVDVYVGAVYAEHRSCDMAALVTRDQARLFYMDFLRDVPADKLKDNMIDNFRNHTPADASPDLRHRIDGFIGLFDRAAKKGSRVEIRYIPGEGTSVSAAGKVLAAPVPGADFASVVWDIWFGRKTCCPDLLRSVRRTCGKE